MRYLIFGLICLIFFMLGMSFHKLFEKSNGRLVIVEESDEYFVAITTPPEELKYHKTLNLDVYISKEKPHI